MTAHEVIDKDVITSVNKFKKHRISSVMIHDQIIAACTA